MDERDNDRFLAAIDERGRWLRMMRALLVDAAEAIGRLAASDEAEEARPLEDRIADALRELDRIGARLAMRSARLNKIRPKRRKMARPAPADNPGQIWLIPPDNQPPEE